MRDANLTEWAFDIPEVNAELVRTNHGALQHRALKLGIAASSITEREPEVVEQDRTVVAKALEWIDADTDSEYLHNPRVVCSRGDSSAKEIGMVAQG